MKWLLFAKSSVKKNIYASNEEADRRDNEMLRFPIITSLE